MANEPISLVTLEEVKTHLVLTDTNSDEQLNNLMSEMSREFIERIDRDIRKKTRTEYHDGKIGQTSICLEHYPVISITSIHDDTDRQFGSNELIPSDDYSFHASSGIVNFETSLSSGFKNVKVVYVSGYEETDIPNDIKSCIKMMIARDFLLNSSDLNSKEASQVLQAKLQRLDKRIDEIIARYRRVKIG